MSAITVQTTVRTTLEKAWECWTKPEHIRHWAFASDDWEAPTAENDLRVGGIFKTRMQAKDGSAGFEFGGVYSNIIELGLIEYDLGDRRHVKITFQESPEGIIVTELFDPELQNRVEKQRAGWQSIMDNFKKYAETKNS
jgi:uncharacterized protein YndB with AHSA1/START domain